MRRRLQPCQTPCTLSYTFTHIHTHKCLHPSVHPFPGGPRGPWGPRRRGQKVKWTEERPFGGASQAWPRRPRLSDVTLSMISFSASEPTADTCIINERLLFPSQTVPLQAARQQTIFFSFI
ncbi:hypothetical protein QQF64_005111 [Cirrhinus molitorella]|uniref:Uncharacterized protein n=1 Tax=Cirrhinus molitorella TaxID=172907 RepID=A0ABR3MI67_9TELE